MKLYESGKLNIVQKRKQILIVPLVIILVAAICMTIFGLTTGSAVNVGTDFTGGYKMRVKIGDRLTDETYQEYNDKIVSIAENLSVHHRYHHSSSHHQLSGRRMEAGG